MKRISTGKYEYRGYTLNLFGYHNPDHCVLWEAVDKDDKACYHAKTKRQLKAMIDEYEEFDETYHN